MIGAALWDEGANDADDEGEQEEPGPGWGQGLCRPSTLTISTCDQPKAAAATTITNSRPVVA